MEWLSALLNSQPFVALFLAIGLGYAAGNIRVAGFSLGAGAVLFVGLLIGIIAPKSAPPPLVGTLGLVLFLYAIGIQYGSDFFRGLAPVRIRSACSGRFFASFFSTGYCGRRWRYRNRSGWPWPKRSPHAKNWVACRSQWPRRRCPKAWRLSVFAGKALICCRSRTWCSPTTTCWSSWDIRRPSQDWRHVPPTTRLRTVTIWTI